MYGLSDMCLPFMFSYYLLSFHSIGVLLRLRNMYWKICEIRVRRTIRRSLYSAMFLATCFSFLAAYCIYLFFAFFISGLQYIAEDPTIFVTLCFWIGTAIHWGIIYLFLVASDIFRVKLPISSHAAALIYTLVFVVLNHGLLATLSFRFRGIPSLASLILIFVMTAVIRLFIFLTSGV